MARKAAESWHARAGFWITLAVTAVTGFGVLQARLAVSEAMHQSSQRELADIRARIAAWESRCDR